MAASLRTPQWNNVRAADVMTGAATNSVANAGTTDVMTGATAVSVANVGTTGVMTDAAEVSPVIPQYFLHRDGLILCQTVLSIKHAVYRNSDRVSLALLAVRHCKSRHCGGKDHQKDYSQIFFTKYPHPTAPLSSG